MSATFAAVTHYVQELNLFPHPLRYKTKVPMNNNWTNISREDDMLLRFRFLGQANIGLLTGPISNVIVLDTDLMKPNDNINDVVCGVEHFNQLALRYPEIKNTLSVKTCSGARHYYYKWDDNLKDIASLNVKCIMIDGKTIKWDLFGTSAAGGARNIVMPPSVVDYNGGVGSYDWIFADGTCPVNGLPTLNMISTMPAILADYIRKNSIKCKPDKAIIHRDATQYEGDVSITREDVIELIDMVSAKTMDSYDGWINLGMALYRVGVILGEDGDGDTWAFEQWLIKSRQSKKSAFNHGDNDAYVKWTTFKDDNAENAAGLLCGMARADNQAAFKRWYSRRNEISPDIFNDIDLSATQETTMPISNQPYNVKEKYFLHDYIMQYSGKVLRLPLKEIIAKLTNDLARVVCKINDGKTLIVIKENPQNLHSVMKLTNFKTAQVDRKLSYYVDKRVHKLSIFSPLYDTELLSKMHLVNIPYPPNAIPPDAHISFNIFPGFKANLVPQVNMSMIEPILNHIKSVWASNDEVRYKYFMSHLAHIIQKPAEKSKICIILQSDGKQIGKGIIINFFMYNVLGDALSVQLNDIDELTGQWSHRFADKLYINIDEPVNATAENYQKTFNVMKNLITEPKVRLENKGVGAITIESHKNFIITTNNEVPIKLEKGDKRYAVFKCNESHMSDPDWFTEVTKAVNNKESADHFMTYLLTYPMVDLKNIPNTEERTELLDMSRPPIEVFIEDVKNGNIPMTTRAKSDDELIEITGLDIYDSYVQWCRDNGHKRPLTNSPVFGKILTKAFGTCMRKKINGKEVKMYKVPKYTQMPIFINE